MLMLHRISRLNVLSFNETMIRLEDLKGRTHDQKATRVNRPSTLRCLSQFIFEKQSSNFKGVMSEKTYPDLMQASPYIESLGTVICLVTSPKFVGISKFRHNLHNGYRSYQVLKFRILCIQNSNVYCWQTMIKTMCLEVFEASSKLCVNVKLESS